MLTMTRQTLEEELRQCEGWHREANARANDAHDWIGYGHTSLTPESLREREIKNYEKMEQAVSWAYDGFEGGRERVCVGHS